MKKIINYAMDKSSSEQIFALIQKEDKSLCLGLALATSLDTLSDWTILQDNLQTKLNDNFDNVETIMQASDMNVYLIDRENLKAFLISEGKNGTITQLPDLPSSARNGITGVLQTQAFYIQSEANTSGQHKLYLGAKNQILVSEDKGNTWDVFYAGFKENENPILIKGNSDMLAVITDKGYLYIAKPGSKDFKSHQLSAKGEPYNIIFNNQNTHNLIVIYKNGTLTNFTYGLSLDIYPLGEVTVPGFIVNNELDASLSDVTRFGGNIYIGVVSPSDTVDLYNSIKVVGYKAGLDTVPFVSGKFPIVKEKIIKTIPKLTMDTQGTMLYLGYYGNFYASQSLGENWIELDISLES